MSDDIETLEGSITFQLSLLKQDCPILQPQPISVNTPLSVFFSSFSDECSFTVLDTLISIFADEDEKDVKKKFLEFLQENKCFCTICGSKIEEAANQKKEENCYVWMIPSIRPYESILSLERIVVSCAICHAIMDIKEILIDICTCIANGKMTDNVNKLLEHFLLTNKLEKSKVEAFQNAINLSYVIKLLCREKSWKWNTRFKCCSELFSNSSFLSKETENEKASVKIEVENKKKLKKKKLKKDLNA